jgi:hypothetical protein
MNTPDSKQVMRIRWHRLWLNRRILWYAFNYYIMKIIKDHLYLCCSGIEFLHIRRCKVGFPFPIRNISGQVKIYGNDREKGLSFRDAFTRTLNKLEVRFPLSWKLDNVARKACVSYRPPAGNDRTYYVEYNKGVTVCTVTQDMHCFSKTQRHEMVRDFPVHILFRRPRDGNENSYLKDKWLITNHK